MEILEVFFFKGAQRGPVGVRVVLNEFSDGEWREICPASVSTKNCVQWRMERTMSSPGSDSCGATGDVSDKSFVCCKTAVKPHI